MSFKNQPSPQGVDPAVVVGTSSTEIVAQNSARKFLMIVNNSNRDVFIGLGVPALQGFGLRISKGGGVLIFEEPGIIPEAAIFAIASASTSVYVQGAI